LQFIETPSGLLGARPGSTIEPPSQNTALQDAALKDEKARREGRWVKIQAKSDRIAKRERRKAELKQREIERKEREAILPPSTND
jgi:hypothetical protein